MTSCARLCQRGAEVLEKLNSGEYISVNDLANALGEHLNLLNDVRCSQYPEICMYYKIAYDELINENIISARQALVRLNHYCS